MTAVRLSRLHQISMRAHDVERAVRFYRDALGLPFLFAAPPGLAFFDCEGVRLMLSIPEPGFDHPGSVLYFAVEDIQRRMTHSNRAASRSELNRTRSRRWRIGKCGWPTSKIAKATR